MLVTEIFTSIQGESTYAGLPCHFIRLSGCNLRCSYCDTDYAYEQGKQMDIEEIISSLDKEIGLVEVTGGEPLLQRETPELVRRLIDDGFKVMIETNGSINIRDIDTRAVVIMDIKTPSSAMADHFEFQNLKLLKDSDEIKFVLTGRRDYEWAVEFIESHLKGIKSNLLFSPAYGLLNPADLANWILHDRLKVRLHLQLHKIIWGSDMRGV